VSDEVVAATDIELPIEHDVIYITGATEITSIDAGNESNGYSGFNGKKVTLISASTAQITDGSNLKISGDYTPDANDTLTLVFRNEAWFEVSRSAN
jgi:hypothetical protein